MTRTTRGRGVRATRALGALLLAGALLGGCATLRSGAAPDGASAALERAHAIMLDDLARALEQVHAPRATTVQVTLDADPMTDAFVERLASAGYGVRRVDADQGDRHVALAVVDEAAGRGGARRSSPRPPPRRGPVSRSTSGPRGSSAATRCRAMRCGRPVRSRSAARARR